MTMSTTIDQRLKNVQQQIAHACTQAGRPDSAVQLLAVSKTQTAERIREAVVAGQTAFGENYLQEALAKQTELSDLDIEWHFIGPIQSNKTADIAAHFDWVHSVDRLKIAQRLSRQRPAGAARLNICLQVNLDNESTKAGISLEHLPALASAIQALPQLQLRGLMAIPAKRSDTQQQQAAFAQLTQALESLKQTIPSLDTLSMGMSADMQAAIVEGATIVRIGSAIFGPREPSQHH